jgi:Fe-S cluster assembly scaffold protein SufB
MPQKLLKYGIGIFSKIGEYPNLLLGEQKTRIRAEEGVSIEQKDEEWKGATEICCDEQNDGSREQIVHFGSDVEARKHEENRRVWQASFPGWEGETCQDFSTIKIPDGYVSNAPVRIELGTASTVYVNVGRRSKVIIEEVGLTSGHSASIVGMMIGQGSEVTYRSDRRSDGASDAHVIRRFVVDYEGCLRLREACLEGGFFRAQTHIRLSREKAEVDVTSLLCGADRQCFDLRYEIIHAAPRTVSNLRVGSVLSGDAKAIVRGLVRVEKNAPGCISRQKEETLLLSDMAEIDAVPMLEIENQDVRCSHAATVGRIDAEKLFYLMSRGIDRAAAEQILIDGFVEPYLSKFA